MKLDTSDILPSIDTRALFAAAPAPLLVLAADAPSYTIIDANEAYLTATMRSREELIGQGMFEAFPDNPDDAEATGVANLRASFERAVVSKRPDAMPVQKYDVPHPAGGFEQRWWEPVNAPVLRSDGEVGAIIHQVLDATRRVRAEQEQRAAEGRNRQIVDSAIDYAIVATSNEGLVTRWNEGAQRILGWTEDEMLGQPAHRFFTPEDVEAGRVETEMRCALETGSGRNERWHRRKSGERFWASGEMTVLRGEAGEAIGFVKVLRDRTRQRLAAEERERLDAELRRLNEQLRTDVTRSTAERNRLWEASPDLLVMLDFRGIVQEANAAWTAVLGHQPYELVGEPIAGLIHADDMPRTLAALRDAAGGPVSVMENRFRHKDGSYRTISWSGAADLGLKLIYATGRDVTARKASEQALREAEEQLRQSQKVEAVGQLTGGVAHDFNNLLTVIRGSVDLLRRPELTEERRIRYIDAIADTADRATKLTGQLLAFARRQSLRPTVFDARKSVANLSNMLRTLTGSRIKVEVVTPDRPCPVNADPSQFDTAIINMAVNARDAMGGEGTLTIAVAAVPELPAMRSHAAIAGDFVAVSLTDTGSGIPPEQIDRIFEPFFTTKGVGQGTGLGLSQVFGFAKQSGGEVAVESRIGEGARFTLYLPRATGHHQETEESDADVATVGHGACVLVVEDNAEVGAFATEALRELGYHTRLATDANAALDALRESDDGFDVVFSDVVMPGMSGVELGQEVRRLYPELPMILTSGYSTVLAENGTHGFELLHKPYSVDELSRVLRKAAAWRARGQGSASQVD